MRLPNVKPGILKLIIEILSEIFAKSMKKLTFAVPFSEMLPLYFKWGLIFGSVSGYVGENIRWSASREKQNMV